MWGATKLEFMALFHAIEHWRIYLAGTRSKVITDCTGLLHLCKIFSDADPSIIRKMHKLARYDFILEHLSGQNNEISDFLSRYVHKGRTDTKSTQTADAPVSSVSSIDSACETEDTAPPSDQDGEPN